LSSLKVPPPPSPPDLIIGGKVIENLLFSNGISFIKPIVKLLQGTLKKKFQNNKMSVILDIPLCEVDEQVVIENFRREIADIKKVPLVLTPNRIQGPNGRYYWGFSPAQIMSSRSPMYYNRVSRNLKNQDTSPMSLRKKALAFQARVKNLKIYPPDTGKVGSLKSSEFLSHS
jgi:hypothetical protein